MAQMSEVTSICLLATRRTGSNHLLNVLRNFDALASYGELFNERRVSGVDGILPLLAELTGLSCSREDDPRLRAYARGNPSGFLKILETASLRQGKVAQCFKIHEGQMEPPQIEEAILSRPNTHMVLLLRRSIDSYISLQKALTADRWMSVDTTYSQVSVDIEAFVEWLDRQRRWYDHWVSWSGLRGSRLTILRYEADVDRPLRIVLWRFARAAKSFNLHLKQPLRIRNHGLRMQDRRSSIASRVANWPEFSAAVKERGLEKQAYGYPLGSQL
jgi:LPS sulfotransferase NodH